jgi:hypothetical protein
MHVLIMHHRTASSRCRDVSQASAPVLTRHAAQAGRGWPPPVPLTDTRWVADTRRLHGPSPAGARHHQMLLPRDDTFHAHIRSATPGTCVRDQAHPNLYPSCTHITRQVVLTSPNDADDTSWVRCAGHCTSCSSCRPRRCVLCCIASNWVARLACPWPPANPINSVHATRTPIHLQRRAD